MYLEGAQGVCPMHFPYICVLEQSEVFMPQGPLDVTPGKCLAQCPLYQGVLFLPTIQVSSQCTMRGLDKGKKETLCLQMTKETPSPASVESSGFK